MQSRSWPRTRRCNKASASKHASVPPLTLQRAIRVLRAGGVVAYPTEAVYGLGCDPHNAAALRRLLTLKRRPARKGLILIAANFSQIEPYLRPITAKLRKKLERVWPGPVTWLLPARPEISRLLRGNHDTLAVRITAHPLAAELCRAYGGAIVSTSANVSGRPAARTALQVRRVFGNRVDYIVPGAAGPSTRPSEIRDALTDRIVRAG